MVAQIAKLWVESDDGTMQCIKWLVFGFLVFMISISVAWAGERGYQLAQAGTASSVQEYWMLFVRKWTIDGGYDTAGDLSADYLEAGRAEGARAKDGALFESQ